MLAYAVHTSGRDGKRQLDKRISEEGGADEGEGRKMAKKCGPLTPPLRGVRVVRRPFEFLLPLKSDGKS